MKKIYYVFIIILLGAGSIAAQDEPVVPVSKRNILNGHTFQSVSLFRSSFVSTDLQANIGFGSTPALKILGVEIDDKEIFTFEGKIAFINARVTYRQRFTPWLAMYITGDIAGRLGTNLTTIMADGLNTITGGKIGWLVRIKQSKKFNLATNIHISNVTANVINVTKFVEDVLDDKPNPSVANNVPAMTMEVGLRGAYAFNPTYALQFFAELDYGESFERERTQGYFSTGIMGEMDFHPKFKVPLGLALGYVLTSDPESIAEDSGFSNIFVGKLGYSASREFELGLEFSYFDVNLSNVEKQTNVSRITLMLKFFF
jgi:hypothetical protein